ncbi:MAG: type IVB secretion system protein IcmH/DotU [Paracoccaceae bacterium]
MTNKDDPFGLSNDAGRTRIRPVRASERPAATPTQARPAAPNHDDFTPTPKPYAAPQGYGRTGSAPPPSRSRTARAHPNPLVAAYATLLELAPELERAAPPAQAETLRVRLQDTLIDARDASVGMGVPLTRANQAAWYVAALIDDIALNTPWGGHSDWPRQPLVVALSGEVDAGTRFFDQLDELMRHPNRDPEMLELAYLCIGLGFRGKYRGEGGAGTGALMALRTQIARLLRNNDLQTAPISPHWQGVAAPDQPRRFAVPLWTVGLAAVALMTAIYMGLGLQLSTKSEQLFALADRLPPAARADIFRPLRENVEPLAELVIEPILFELLPEFQAKAPADTAAALKGREDVSLVVLVVQGSNPEVFRSAKADLNTEYGPLIASIAAVVLENAELIGGVTVAGYTDNVPVQKSNPFASNQGLSEARAKTIADLLVAAGISADLVKSEGRADSDPVGDNATKAGRAQNRRIEIKIEKRL